MLIILLKCLKKRKDIKVILETKSHEINIDLKKCLQNGGIIEDYYSKFIK